MGVWGWWAFDIFTLMASYLSTEAVGAQTILRSVGLLAFMMPVGLSTGARIYMNSSLGEGRPRVAMQYYKVALAMSLLVGSLQLILLHFGQETIIKAFTDQVVIAESIKAAWVIFIAFNVFDTVQIMGSGVMRCALLMGWGSIFNFIAYFILGIPVTYYAAFTKDMGIRGIWIGPTCSGAFLTVCYNIMIKRINWKELIETIAERTRVENEMKERLKKEQEAQKNDIQ